MGHRLTIGQAGQVKVACHICKNTDVGSTAVQGHYETSVFPKVNSTTIFWHVQQIFDVIKKVQ